MIDWKDYEKRVTNYENQGMTRSDAQGTVDMELMQEQSTKERLAKLYPKGYRWCVEFEQTSNIEPLAVKQMTEIAPLIREQFPNEKNWSAWEFDQNGNKNQKWIPTNNENFFTDN